MVETVSTMLDLGTNAPGFELPNPSTGQVVRLTDYLDAPIMVVFSCNHCPYVLHILHSLAEFARGIQQQGIAVVMINANDVENYSADSPEKMITLGKEYGFCFPYLYDESQQVATAYRAACTPDFFLFDAQHRLVYRGQYDEARPGNNQPISGVNLRAASDAVLNSTPIPEQQIPSMGCNIKWRAGNEPDY